MTRHLVTCQIRVSRRDFHYFARAEAYHQLKTGATQSKSIYLSAGRVRGYGGGVGIVLYQH